MIEFVEAEQESSPLIPLGLIDFVFQISRMFVLNTKEQVEVISGPFLFSKGAILLRIFFIKLVIRRVCLLEIFKFPEILEN